MPVLKTFVIELSRTVAGIRSTIQIAVKAESILVAEQLALKGMTGWVSELLI